MNCWPMSKQYTHAHTSRHEFRYTRNSFFFSFAFFSIRFIFSLDLDSLSFSFVFLSTSLFIGIRKVVNSTVTTRTLSLCLYEISSSERAKPQFKVYFWPIKHDRHTDTFFFYLIIPLKFYSEHYKICGLAVCGIIECSLECLLKNQMH